MAKRSSEIAGLIERRKARSTKTLVGLYLARDAGIDTDESTPWCCVCETHGVMMCFPTQKAAKVELSHPEDWCADCQETVD